MKPTIKQLEEYLSFLYKKQLIENVLGYLKENKESIESENSVSFADLGEPTRIVFDGGQEYDDEGSYYFQLNYIYIYFGDYEMKFTWDDEELLDSCGLVAKLIGDDEDVFSMDFNNLVEPFDLVIN
jgi:hypothetical protein